MSDNIDELVSTFMEFLRSSITSWKGMMRNWVKLFIAGAALTVLCAVFTFLPGAPLAVHVLFAVFLVLVLYAEGTCVYFWLSERREVRKMTRYLKQLEANPTTDELGKILGVMSLD